MVVLVELKLIIRNAYATHSLGPAYCDLFFAIFIIVLIPFVIRLGVAIIIVVILAISMIIFIDLSIVDVVN